MTIGTERLGILPLWAALTISLVGCDAADEPVAELDVIELDAVDSLVEHSRTVAQLPGFDLDITADEGDVVVTWAGQGGGGATVTVWRGSEPYFEPGDPGSIVLVENLADTFFVDPGADANDEPYYYRVVVDDNTGTTSTTAGKYVHTVLPGYNKISQPLLSDVADASALAEDLPEMFSALLWDADNQQWAGWMCGADWQAFEFGLGQVPIVFPQWDTNTTYHQYGIVPDVDELQVALSVGANFVTVPLSFGDTSAAELLASVPNAVDVGQWDNAEQSTRWYGLNGGEDFEVAAGSGVQLVVTAESVWPAPVWPTP